jgi:hypothetical protein
MLHNFIRNKALEDSERATLVEMPLTTKIKVRLHRYICLWGASERKLEKSLKPNQKDPRKNQGKRARHSTIK